MNIATDVIVTPSSLNKTGWAGLKRIAAEGSWEQQKTLLAWSCSGVAASLSEELHFLVYGWESEARFLSHETTRTINELNQAFSKGS